MVAVEESQEERGRRVIVAPPRPVGRTRRERQPIALPRLPSTNLDAAQRLRSALARRARSQEGTETVVPTVPIRHVLIVMAVGFALASIFGARGLVHSGQGMDIGIERTVTLGIGQPLLAVTETLGLTWPWDTAEHLLGRNLQTSAPLLSAPPSRSSQSPSTSATSPRSHESARPPAVKPPALFVPTPKHPLRLLVAGDSLTEYLAPMVADMATRAGPTHAFTDTHYGTGIVRPDYVDWSVVAAQEEAQYHPDAVFVFMGGNDNQNMVAPNGSIIYTHTPAWTREYQRRVEIVMRTWLKRGARRVYWLAMPPARQDYWSKTNAQINVALQRAATDVPGAVYLNLLGPVTDKGKYADFVMLNGQPTLVRTQDGIHLNATGSQIVASEIMRVIKRDWHLGVKVAHSHTGTTLTTRKRT
jgi:hypothetical protein